MGKLSHITNATWIMARMPTLEEKEYIEVKCSSNDREWYEEYVNPLVDHKLKILIDDTIIEPILSIRTS